MSHISRRQLFRGAAITGAAAIASQFVACSSSDSKDTRDSRARRRRDAPNIIVVTADDMRADEAPFMANTLRLVRDAGLSFPVARHNIALCSPARSGFLSGQLALRHHVYSQSDPYLQMADESKSLPVWLHDAGYRTAVVGKYLTANEGRHNAPGWDVRRQLIGDSQDQLTYQVWDGNRALSPNIDQTQYLQQQILEFVRNAREPFFLWFTPTADHAPFQTPAGYDGKALDVVWPDHREDDVADKPAWIRALPPHDDTVLAAVRANQIVRIQELLGLDDTIAALFTELDALGVLARTAVMFTSDNGIVMGEHRIPNTTKNLPYEPCVRVPCFVRAPGVHPVASEAVAYMSVDLTATCLDLAGARADVALDGVSLLDLAASPARYAERSLLYERDNRDDPPGLTCPAAKGVFTATRKFVRYETTPPTYELYDIERDPDELENVADDPAYADERTELDAELDRLLAG